MAETLTVYGREFTIGKPRVTHYISLLKFFKRLISEGYTDRLEELSAADDIGGFDFFFGLVEAIEEDHLTHLAAVLLQDDVDETIEFIEENGGVELGWLMESFAINAELADLGQVVESFRRAQKAIRGWRRAGAAKG